jgi:hypothetical protein
MFDVGEALAAALSSQFPDRYPALPETSASDTAPKPASLAPGLITSMLLVALAVLILDALLRRAPRTSRRRRKG